MFQFSTPASSSNQSSSDRIFVFKTKEKSLDSRSYLLAIPESQIQSLKSIVGGHNVCLEVNGIPVEGSFEKLVNALGKRIDVSDL